MVRIACPTVAGDEITDADRVYNLLDAQDGFIFSAARYPAYIGAWGTGKSFALIQRAMLLSEESAGNLGVIFRREYTDLRDSTMRDFERYTGRKVSSDRSVILPNKSEIMFRHLEEWGGTIQNINLGWFAIEQADELDNDEIFRVLQGRLRRHAKRRSGFLVGNTNGHDWQYKTWKLAKDSDYKLYEATSYDAARYLPPDTIESWKKLEVSAPKIYRRFVLNSWDESDTTDVIIRPEMVAACTRPINIRAPVRRIVSCDVSRYGDDKTVAYAIENGRVIGGDAWDRRDTMETVGRLIVFAKRHGGIESFAVDEIGVGGGVVDRLSELGKHVIAVNASERASDPAYYNRRAEIYSTGAALFGAGRVYVPPEETELIEQLSWAKYKQLKSNGVFQVEAKDDIKARYGKSPDYADALLIGLWATPQARIFDGFGGDDYSNAPMMVTSAVAGPPQKRYRRTL